MAGAGSTPDDLEAVRTVVDALRNFESEDQRRIIRWAQEKLGLASPGGGAPNVAPQASAAQVERPAAGANLDIRSFLQQKDPGSDVQFAAAVAYFYAFEAPDSGRKQEITASDLKEAARLSGRDPLSKPIVTLRYPRGVCKRVKAV